MATDINHRLITDLQNPERGLATVEALLAHRQRLRAQLIQSEQQQLRAASGPGTPSLPVSRARL